MLNIAILLADVTKPEMSNCQKWLTLTWPVTSLVTPRSINFVFPRQFFQGFQMPLDFFRIGPVVSEIWGGLEIAPPPVGRVIKNTPVGRGLKENVIRWNRPVRRHVWRWMSERERDKPLFGKALGRGLSGFRDKETGDAHANVQSPHLRLL